MPKGISEISSGNQFSRSAGDGNVADSATRSFRVLLNSPDETFDIEASCGVYVGDAHPSNSNVSCVSFDAKYEGDSRMVLVATFTYQSEALAADTGAGGGGGGGAKRVAPDIRPANYSIGAELIDVPVSRWRMMNGSSGYDDANGVYTPTWAARGRPLNPAFDTYEGISTTLSVATIKVSQFSYSVVPPYSFVGSINSLPITFPNGTYPPHMLMQRSFSSTPVVESWGGRIYRGFMHEFTFAAKSQHVEVNWPDAGEPEGVATGEVELGWNMAVVVEGRNVICFDVAAAVAAGQTWKDPYGQPLKVGEDKVPLIPANPVLSDGLAAGQRAHAQVAITGFSDRGLSQAPASDPIALNFDGTPRKITSSRKPLVVAVQVYDAFDFNQIRLRFF